MPSRSCHIFANYKISSFHGWVVFHYTQIYHTFFIHSSVDGHLGCSHVLANVNKGSYCLLEWVFSHSLDKYSGVAWLDHTAVLFFIFWGISILFFLMAVPMYIPTNSGGGFPFLHILSPALVISCLFYNSQSSKLKWSHYSFETPESPLDCKEIRPVNPKGNQSWILIGRTCAEAEVPILWPPDVKSQLIRKDPDAEKDWGQEEKGTTEDEMVGRPHWLNGHEFEQAPGDGKGQGGLACCSPWGRRELDMTERRSDSDN